MVFQLRLVRSRSVRKFLLLGLMAGFAVGGGLEFGTANAQRSRGRGIDPVKVGDEIEIKFLSKWIPATVLGYANGRAKVEYEFAGATHERDYSLEDMRFPNGEGHWLIWSDASGKFKVEARYVSRTATHVTIRKVDGSEVTVPIEALNSRLRRELGNTPVTGEENKFDGAVPVRVGDEVQVKHFSTWYDGRVMEVTKEGAVVEFEYRSFGPRKEEFKFADMRFPNGEGRWREWSDTSGEFKIIARYISRDGTHVTIRKEDNTDVRVEIARLNPKLRKLLSDTPIFTARPREVAFTIPPGTFDRKDDSPVGSLADVSLDVSAPLSDVAVQLSEGGFAFPLKQGSAVSTAVPIGGPEEWIAIGTTGGFHGGPAPATLHWASLSSKKSIEGPQLLADERILAYSALQARMVTAVVTGTWNTPVRLCTYRVRPGDTKAVPEVSWEIPKQKYASNSSSVKLRLVGRDRLLMGYGSSVSLWNLTDRKVEYALNGLHGHHFWVSPDQRYVVVKNGNRSMAVHNTVTGERLAHQTWEGYGSSTACFSQDGRNLVVATSGGIKAWSLPEKKPAVELPLGGVNADDGSPLSLLSGGWIASGPQFYSIGLKLVVWRYDARHVQLHHQQMVGRKMLAVATAGFPNSKTVLVGAAAVPHKDAIELMKQVDTDKLLMLRQGAPIRIEATGDPRVGQGLRAAARANGWVEDPNSDVVLSGSAGPGESQQVTYRVTQFGPGGGMSEESHNVRPWKQKVEIRYGDQRAWGTAAGGVPTFITASGGSTIGDEVQKSSNPQYYLFDKLKIPQEILYPKYQQGLGRTWITADGFVDEAK